MAGGFAPIARRVSIVLFVYLGSWIISAVLISAKRISSIDVGHVLMLGPIAVVWLLFASSDEDPTGNDDHSREVALRRRLEGGEEPVVDTQATVLCRHCGREISAHTVVCPRCDSRVSR
ncbi:MAG: hypothetical protein CMJ64_24475 [Planctomycetaceae bacterium]|nr:hypothetical protein [Planctomycetaceae bacterium]